VVDVGFLCEMQERGCYAVKLGSRHADPWIKRSQDSGSKEQADDPEKTGCDTTDQARDACAFRFIANRSQGNATEDNANAGKRDIDPIERSQARQETHDHASDRQYAPNQAYDLHLRTSEY
jgi:hypothetical protein